MKPSLISVPVYCWQMVGRKAELACLLQQFATVETGQGSTVAVSGDAGIGKSRLVQAFKETIGDRDAAFFTALCSEHVQAPYHPFERILSEIANSPLRQWIRRVDADPLTAAEEKLRYFSSVAQALRDLAARRPVVVVVEDVHWADAASLELIAYLSQRLSHDRVLLIVTFRGDDVARNDELLVLLASLRRTRVTHVELRALAPREIQEIIYRALHGRRRISAAARARIEEAGEGNPLFIEELAASVVVRPVSVAYDLPTTIRELVSARLDALPANERPVLLDAAVVGKVFWRGALERMGGSGTNLSEALDSLEARDLIRREPQSWIEREEQFTFKHVMIREVAYATLPRAKRRERHALVAGFLEEATGDAGATATALALHWREAGDNERALEYLLLAAEQAGRGWAKHEAAALYKDALELVPEGDTERRREIGRKQAMALAALAHIRDARHLSRLPDREPNDV